MTSAALHKNLFYDNPADYYDAMINDITHAKKSVYLESYRFRDDNVGNTFLLELEKKAKEGVEVVLLLDSWGTRLDTSYFDKLISHGGKVRFYKKIKLFWDFFTKNHRRNHRKLLIIDHNITYIGSGNVTGYALNWRESVIRILGDISEEFEKIFFHDYEKYRNYDTSSGQHLKSLQRDGFTIIRDYPSITIQEIMHFYIKLISSAKKEIVIETPYFLPGISLRKSLVNAVARSVKTTIILPLRSDVQAIDVLRSQYLGELHKNGVNILFYIGENLHAKAMLIDNKTYTLGSANFDYRSFRYQHEIIVSGEQEDIVQQLDKHFRQTIEMSTPFNYNVWEKRPKIQKTFEKCLIPFRHLL